MTANAAPESLHKLNELLTRARSGSVRPSPADAPATPLEGTDHIVTNLIFSVLLWESNVNDAIGALERIRERFIDVNELRVSPQDEIAGVINADDDVAEQRASSIRRALNQIYREHHCVTLASLSDLPKREARDALFAIEALPRFAASRVALLSLSCHCAPVDSRILELLTGEGVVDPGTDAEGASGLLERAIRAGELAKGYLALERAIAACERPGTIRRAKTTG